MATDDDQTEPTARRRALMSLTAADLIARIEAAVWAKGDGRDERHLRDPRRGFRPES